MTMSQSYNISEAKAQLSALIEKVVEQGEEIIINKAGKPVARLTRFTPTKRPRRLDLFQGQITVARDFDEWPADIARSLGING